MILWVNGRLEGLRLIDQNLSVSPKTLHFEGVLINNAIEALALP